METLLLIVVVLLAIAIFALAGYWFFHESSERERRRKRVSAVPAENPSGGRNADYVWDGGTKTSPRQLR